jgi:hypothetical protein
LAPILTQVWALGIDQAYKDLSPKVSTGIISAVFGLFMPVLNNVYQISVIQRDLIEPVV